MGHLKTRSYLIAFLAFIAILALTLSACQKKAEEKAEVKGKKEEVIKIGAILPLTGNVSLFGGWLKDGIEFAVSQSGLPAEVIYEDNMGKASKAVDAFQKLTKVDKVHAIITSQTPVANVLTPLTSSAKVFTVLTFADLPKGDKKYILNYHFPVEDEASILSKFAYNFIGKKGGILTIGDEFGRLGAEVFIETFRNLKGEIVYNEQFMFSEKDFRSLLLKLKDKDPDFIFIIAYDQQLLSITKTMKEMHMAIPLIGPNVITVYLHLIKEYLPNISYFTMSFYDAHKSKGVKYNDFITAYKNKKGKEPTMVTAEAYEATMLLLRAIKEKGVDKIPEYFNNLTYSGIFGRVVIDNNRQAHFPLAVVKLEKGEKKKVEWKFTP